MSPKSPILWALNFLHLAKKNDFLLYQESPILQALQHFFAKKYTLKVHKKKNYKRMIKNIISDRF